MPSDRNRSTSSTQSLIQFSQCAFLIESHRIKKTGLILAQGWFNSLDNAVNPLADNRNFRPCETRARAHRGSKRAFSFLLPTSAFAPHIHIPACLSPVLYRRRYNMRRRIVIYEPASGAPRSPPAMMISNAVIDVPFRTRNPVSP